MRDYDDIFNDLMKRRIDRIFVGSDDDLEKVLRRQLGRRGVIYTELLKNYSKTTKWRNRLKEFHKWAFFWLVMAAGFSVVHYISRVMNRVLEMESTEEFLNSVPVIITAFVSLLSTVIGVPLTITKFLFNTKEDDNITGTIHHTQDHDNEEATFLLKKDAKIQNDEPADDEMSRLSFHIRKEKEEDFNPVS